MNPNDEMMWQDEDALDRKFEKEEEDANGDDYEPVPFHPCSDALHVWLHEQW